MRLIVVGSGIVGSACAYAAGATRETGSGFDYRVTPGGLAEVLHEALTVAPGLASGTYLETRIGFRPMGPDIRPLLGTVPGIDGLTVATGLGASGLTMGPYAGELAARVALGSSLPLDLSPFSPVRASIRTGTRALRRQSRGRGLEPVALVHEFRGRF